jgi:O-antigen ligase
LRARSGSLLPSAESITSTTLQSNTERVLMWQSAYEMFKDHPVLGVGLGQYAPKYLNEYKSPQAKERQNHSHNNFLQMLAENGIVGFLGFVLLFGYLLLSSFRNSVRKLSPYHVLIFGCTLAFILQGFTEYNFGNSAVIKYYWGTLGCLLVLARENRDGFGESSFLRFKFS